MKLNMNATVRVKLNKRGRQILLADHEQFAQMHPQAKLKFRLPKEDKDGYSKWQLWTLFEQFGPHIHLGFEVPFDTDIVIDDAKSTAPPQLPSLPRSSHSPE